MSRKENAWKKRIEHSDRWLTGWMRNWGHHLDRWALGVYFMWFGTIKMLGHKSATSIIAETVYIGDPEITAPFLGLWEAAIGICLVVHPLARVAIALLAVRLPGTVLALALKPEVCWTDALLVPTTQGQYLIKDVILLTAAMVIGGGLARDDESPRSLTASLTKPTDSAR